MPVTIYYFHNHFFTLTKFLQFQSLTKISGPVTGQLPAQLPAQLPVQLPAQLPAQLMEQLTAQLTSQLTAQLTVSGSGIKAGPEIFVNFSFS